MNWFGRKRVWRCRLLMAIRETSGEPPANYCKPPCNAQPTITTALGAVCGYRGALVSPAHQNPTTARLDPSMGIPGPTRATVRPASTNAHGLSANNAWTKKSPVSRGYLLLRVIFPAPIFQVIPASPRQYPSFICHAVRAHDIPCGIMGAK